MSSGSSKGGGDQGADPSKNTRRRRRVFDSVETAIQKEEEAHDVLLRRHELEKQERMWAREAVMENAADSGANDNLPETEPEMTTFERVMAREAEMMAAEPLEEEDLEYTLDDILQSFEGAETSKRLLGDDLDKDKDPKPISTTQADKPIPQSVTPLTTKSKDDLLDWAGNPEVVRPDVLQALRSIPDWDRETYPSMADMAYHKQKLLRRQVVEGYATPYMTLGASRWFRDQQEGNYLFNAFPGQHNGSWTKSHKATMRFAPVDKDLLPVQIGVSTLKFNRDNLYKNVSSGALSGRLTPNVRRQQRERLQRKVARDRAVSVGLRSFLLRGRRLMRK